MEMSSEAMFNSSPACPRITTSPPARNSPGEHDESIKQGPERPLAEVITEKFAPFDADNLVIQPFQNEAARDAKFEQELSEMLLNAILETHAWAAARPKHEATLESQKLDDQISNIMSSEREQGMCSLTPSFSSSFSMTSFTRLVIAERTRAKLAEFVRKMKTAIAALTEI